MRSYKCDISRKEDVYALGDRVMEDFGTHVSVLINNAGIVSGQHFMDIPDSR